MKMIRFRKHLSYIGVILLLLPLASLVTATPAPQEVQSGAPTVVSYQGQVQVGGTPFSGTGYFKFAIVDAGGTTSYWSNDDTSTGGGEPSGAVPLTVDNGLFNVLLGDTTLTKMTQALSADVFSETDSWLRVWFSSDNNTYQQLTPDQRIAAVAYALQAENAADADTLDGFEGSDYQLQVSGSCTVGSTIQSINADGNVACEAHDTRLGFSLTSVRSSGYDNAITIGWDGLPVISWYDYSRNELNVIHCEDAACSTSVSHTLPDWDGDPGEYNSIAIGADGLPVISYYDSYFDELKVFHCGDAACSAGNTFTTVDSDSGEYTSIAIGTDGLPVISYMEGTNNDLNVVHCGDVTCSKNNTINTLDTFSGIVGYYNSIAIGTDGLPVISYYKWGAGNLKVAHCEDVTCSTHTLNAVESGTTIDVGRYTSITIGGDGLPVISYYDVDNHNLKVAHCGNAACSMGNTITTVDDSTGDVGKYTSINIGGDGLPIISYYDETNGDLKLAHCGDVACSSGNILTTVDTNGDVGLDSSITIGVDGLPVISYHKNCCDLKVAHCSNVFCIPYWRRR